MALDKKVSIAIIGKTDQFVKSLTKGQKALQGLGSAASAIGKTAALGLGAIGVAAGTVGKEMVDLASEAKEAEAAFQATFGDAIPEFGTFIEDFSKKAGLAEFELQDLLKTTGMVLQGIDMSAEASVNFSKDLSVLAGDVAAFNNVQGGTQPVLEAMTKALLGERESLKTYGIAISEAEVQTQAFAMTGKTAASELTKQEKAQATLELITRKSAVTQGYLNAEQESFATKSKQAQAKIKELKATLGAELLPIVEQLLPVIIDVVQEIGPSLISAIKTVAPFVSSIGQLFADLAPPIIAIITLLLNLLAPAFRKFTEIVNKYIAPFLTNLPKNFENMINRIIDSLNKFIRTINGFASKVGGILGKIGINIDLPKLKEFERVSFGFADNQVKSVVAQETVDPAQTLAALTTQQQTAQAGLNQAVGAGLTVNFNAAVTNPEDAKNVVIQGLKEFNRTNGALNRVITIE